MRNLEFIRRLDALEKRVSDMEKEIKELRAKTTTPIPIKTKTIRRMKNV